MEFWMPPEAPTGIATAQTLAVGELNLDGTLVRNLVTNRFAVLPRAASPYFIFSATTDRCRIWVEGLDIWGQKIGWLLIKQSDGTVQKSVISNFPERNPAMTRIDSIRVTEATVAAGTVSVGWTYATGTTNVVALPMAFPDVGNLTSPTASRTAYFTDLDGFWTGVAAPGFATAIASSSASDVQRGSIAITTGTTTSGSQATSSLVNSSFTAATFTNATLTLTKTGAFTNYVYQNGDTIQVTGGTGVTQGLYAVRGRVDNDSIVLFQNMGGANPADVVFRINKTILVKSNAFTNLSSTVAASGNATVSITAGTGVSNGTYTILSKVSNNAVVLASDPGGTSPSDVTFTVSASPARWGRGVILFNPALLDNQ
jgi:hypothetical protein